jgi:hypothetical protein
MTVPYDIVQDVMRVIDLISKGKTPTAACDDAYVSYTTFCAYTEKYPQLAQMRKEAEDRLYDTMAEALPRIFENNTDYQAKDPKEAAVISSNIKWLLERRRQKAYGAHSTVEHHITADREVLDALQRAKARAEGRLVDSSVKVVEDVLDLTLLSNGAYAPTEIDEERFQRELSELT